MIQKGNLALYNAILPLHSSSCTYIYRYFSVVCRAMGFGFGQARCCAEFGQGGGDILMSNLRCTVSEASLSECPFDGWGVHQCSHEEDAGVFCHNQTPPTQTVTILDKTTTTRSVPGKYIAYTSMLFGIGYLLDLKKNVYPKRGPSG